MRLVVEVKVDNHLDARDTKYRCPGSGKWTKDFRVDKVFGSNLINITYLPACPVCRTVESGAGLRERLAIFG